MEKKMETNIDHRKPATAEDAAHLKKVRARVWPQVFICIILVVAVVAWAVVTFGWAPVLIALAVVIVVGLAVLVGYGNRHPMSAEEIRLAEEELPGHDIFDKEDVRITAGHSYHYDCAPSDVYPYLAQMNLTKAGFYSFQFFERFFGFHIRNDYTIRPEWQSVEKGDWLYYHQNGAGTGVVDVKENEYITTYSDTRFKPTQELAIAWRPKWMKGFAWTWNFIFLPEDDGESTRFISYLQAWWPENTGKATITRLMLQWGLASNFMMNGMARKFGKLAEADAKARRAGAARPGYNYTK